MFHDYLIMKMDPLLSSKGVSIDRLRAFCAVVETGSVTVAADRDPSHQSQFSRQITELEDALGVKLFDRINRRLVPTDAGRSLALMTRSYFEGLAELCRVGRSTGDAIKIAAGESIFQELVFPRLSRMRSALPGCRFVFENCPTQEAVQRLKSGRVEVGIIRDNAATDDLETSFLTRVSYRLVVPRQLLPQGHSGGLDCLRGLPMAILRGGGEFARTLATVTETAGVTVIPAAEADSFGALQELVRTGTVAAILPEWMAKALTADRFAIVQIEEFEILDRSLVVASHTRTKSLRPFIDSAVPKLVSIWRP